MSRCSAVAGLRADGPLWTSVTANPDIDGLVRRHAPAAAVRPRGSRLALMIYVGPPNEDLEHEILVVAQDRDAAGGPAYGGATRLPSRNIYTHVEPTELTTRLCQQVTLGVGDRWFSGAGLRGLIELCVPALPN